MTQVQRKLPILPRRTAALRAVTALLVALMLSGVAVDVLAVDPKYKQQLSSARRQLLRGQAEQAIKVFERLLEQEPFELGASVGYADALISLQRYGDAAVFLQEALAKNERQADLYRMEVKLHRAQNERADAFASVLNVLGADPERSSWAVQETRQLLLEGLPATNADAQVREASEANPADLNYPVLRSLIAALDERPEDGLALMVVVEDERGLAGRGVLRYAEELGGLGQSSAALAAYQVAAERTEHPSHRSRILFTVAELQERQGSYRDALASLAVIAEEREGHTAAGRALLKSADIYQTYLDDPGGALEVYLLLRDDPILGHHRPDMLLQMGDCYVRLDRLEEAAVAFNEVIPEALDPEQAEVAAFRGAEVQFYAGNIDSALILFQDMAENHPRSMLADDAAYRYILLNKYQSVMGGLLTQAFGRMEWGRLAGDSTAVDSSASFIIAERPKGELAGEAWLALADLSVAAGAYDVAVERLANIVEVHAADESRAPVALKRQGDLLLERLNRPQEALERYEIILTDYPNSVLTGEARRMVEKLRRDLKS